VFAADATSSAAGTPDDDDPGDADDDGDENKQQQAARGAHKAFYRQRLLLPRAAEFLIRFSNGGDTLGGVNEERLTRRSILRLAGLAAASFGAGAWKAEEAEGGGPAAVESGAVTCVLTPELTEGPYYIPNEKLRRNITDGHHGTALILQLAVVDASTCKPIKGASVDIWHADAAGNYSGFGAGRGSRTFMRGIQKTDARGIATFRTVYPGWYPGRSVHIHVKVHVRGNVVYTGQLFFSDTLTDRVYRNAPYNKRPSRTTRNASDSIFVNGGRKSMLSVRRRSAGGYLGRITMGVHRS
jgi:protocatechuate 3,4-dioxygenase beta subunit